jgi:hypothetical protein
MWLSDLQQATLLSHGSVGQGLPSQRRHVGCEGGHGQCLLFYQVSPSQQYNFGSQGGVHFKLIG